MLIFFKFALISTVASRSMILSKTDGVPRQLRTQDDVRFF